MSPPLYSVLPLKCLMTTNTLVSFVEFHQIPRVHSRYVRVFPLYGLRPKGSFLDGGIIARVGERGRESEMER